jgi:predicted nuclease with TOPRIM domain
MDTQILNILVPVIVALVASVPGVIAVIAQRRRDKVEVQALATEKLIASSSTIQESYKDLLTEFKSSSKECKDKLELLEVQIKDQEDLIRLLIQENTELKDSVSAMKVIVEDLRAGITLLIDQIEKLGHKPAYRPKGG